MASSWHKQMLATLHRNLRVKFRDAGHTFQEIVLPIYIITLLVVVKFLEPQLDIPASPLEAKVDTFCIPADAVSGTGGVCLDLPSRPREETVLAFVPQQNAAISKLVMDVVQQFGLHYEIPALSPKGFDSEDDMLDFYYSHPEMLFAALVFEDKNVFGANVLPADLHYSIRINGSYLPSTSETIGNKEDCQLDRYVCDANGYLNSGFLALQSVVSQVARATAMPGSACSNKKAKSTFVQQQALPAYHRSFASLEFQLFTALYMVLALSPVLQTTLTHIVQEKQSLLKDCMLLMGLRESVYWISWLITYALMSAMTTLILVFTARWTTLFEFTSTGMLFLIIYPFTLSLITMAFALSTVFSKVQSATSFSGLLIMLCSLMIIPIDLLQWSTGICAALSLISPIGLALAVDVIVRAEGRGQGITFYNFWSTAKGTSPLSVGALVCIFIGDAIIYGVIAWYMDNTWPHPERGPKRPWNFCFSANYWFPSRGEVSYMLAPQDNPAFVSQFQMDEASFVVGTPSDVALDVDPRHPVQEDDPNMEPVEPEIARRAAIICKDLKKAYYRKRKWWQFWDIEGGRGQASRQQWKPEAEVIKGLNLNLYEGQLFAFVGHSRSGKTALVSMLAGLSQRTSGEAYIYGLPISDGGAELQSLVGFCPQEDIVLDLLTVREQLKYFAAIKGESLHLGEDAFDQNKQSTKSSTERTEELLQELQLLEQADTQASELGASAKRKLSLAIALVGDPQVVIMDNPTANMDADARRVFWDMLKKHQKGRVFIFTTDSMEEADLVADRKAILSHGVLKCCGSSLFLRNRFGLSYLLHITKGETFNAGSVLRVIEGHIPEVTVIPTSRGQAHTTYKLPLGFPSETSALMTELTAKAAELGVEGGALEATTLEEVFMQFQDEDEEEAAAVSVHDASSMHTWGPESSEDMEEEALLTSNNSHGGDDSVSKFRTPQLKMQVIAMLRSRLSLYRRNLVAVLVTFGLPVVITLGVLLAQTIVGEYDTMKLPLDNPKFGNSVPLMYSVSTSSNVVQATSLLQQLGPNHKLLNQSALYDRFDIGGIASDGGLDAIGISFDQLDLQNCTVEYTVFYQPSHIHELPSVVAMLDNSVLHSLNSSANGTFQHPLSIHVANHPLSVASLRSAADFLVIMLMAIGLLVVPPVLGVQVVVDKQLGLLSLFRVSGMKSFAYWFATVVTDLTLYYISSFLVLAIGMAFGHVPFYKDANLAIFFLFLTTMPALALLSYVLSFFFLTAQGAASLLYVYFILAALMPYFWILVIPGNNISYSWHSFLNVVDPPYALISGLHFIVTSIVETKGVNDPSMNSYPRVYTFEWNNYILLSIGGAAVAILPLLLCIWQLDVHETEPEAKIMNPPAADRSSETNEDSFQDVESSNELAREKERVQANVGRWVNMGLTGGDGPEGDLILCCGLGKNYDGSPGTYGIGAVPGIWAFRDLWLAVGRGETVALVGGQKSGKSSLIHALAGTIPLSFGDALINGESVRHAYRSKQKIVGLCPQFEAVYYSMTVREHLDLFAVLKGVPEPHGLAVEATLQAMQLIDVANEIVGRCSVGARRRLSIGIATLGGSSVLLLDEPSAGTDIATKRRVWKHLASQSGQRGTLICTQSFEEAEALGGRVGILINGQLKCLASPQELKLRYGSSYSLSVRASSEKMPGIREFISTLYPSAENTAVESTSTLTDDNIVELVEGVGLSGHARFRVPVQDLFGLVRLLQELEFKREELGIMDYVVSQPTLRQVFHRLTLGDSSS